MRRQTAEEFKALSGAARQSGVESRIFGVFHDAGYKGLYGGLGNEAIKSRKRVAPRENLMDRMNATELAANQFRMTQTRDKLAKDAVNTQRAAIQTHETVGKEVRDAIRRTAARCRKTFRRPNISNWSSNGSRPWRRSWLWMRAMPLDYWGHP